ncbi:MAG: phosphoribosyltransferase [Candidatus Hydrothermarchaeota archaeon]
MIFKDREEAGKILGEKLAEYKEDAIVLAIPRGGVPVAYRISKKINAPLDVVVVRKIPIPSDPEAGFGAVTADGTIVLNEPLVSYLRLEPREIEFLARKVMMEVSRRIKKYRKEKPFPEITGKNVIVVDDGLASGFTMLAALKYLKKFNPRKIIIAVPTASARAIEVVEPEADEIVNLISDDRPFFAVASFYESFPDLTDEEVIEYLEKKLNEIREITSNLEKDII